HLAVRNDFPPNLAPPDRRPVVVNRDVRQPDALRHASALADARNIQLRRLAAVFELRFRARGQKAESCQSCTKAQNTLPHAAHNRTILSRCDDLASAPESPARHPRLGGTASGQFREQRKQRKEPRMLSDSEKIRHLVCRLLLEKKKLQQEHTMTEQ